MGYLKSDDYAKIKNIIEMFVMERLTQSEPAPCGRVTPTLKIAGRKMAIPQK